MVTASGEGLGHVLCPWAEVSMRHLINRRLEGPLSVYRFMKVCKCLWISFSQIIWNDLCNHTGEKLLLLSLCSEELAILLSNKVFLSLLALEQGGTSSPLSQVTWIIYSSSRELASHISFLLFSDRQSKSLYWHPIST